MTDTAPAPIAGAAFAVVASGYADGPSQALVRYLNERGARSVTAINHPLVPESVGEHVVERHEGGVLVDRSVLRRPNRPPLTYGFDLVTPLRHRRVDGWFGFNCVATWQGLLLRRLQLVRRVIHWNIDFVPDRFGTSRLTQAYEWLDRSCCVRSDGRVELSEASRDGRSASYALPGDARSAEVVPMGSWFDEAPKTGPSSLDAPRLVFLGHLVERMGLDTLLDSLSILDERGSPVAADIIGGGPLLQQVRDELVRRGLTDRVTVHGYVEDFGRVREMLARSCVGVAPYSVDPTSFSRFADPGKLKAYLGAGLPILLTDVPPNAGELVEHAGAELLEPNAASLADAVERLVTDGTEWQRRHEAALRHGRTFDWNTLLSRALPRLGFTIGDGGLTQPRG